MEAVAAMLKALSEATRLRILALLASTEGRELCICDLTAALALPQSTVSRHMAILRQAGWVLAKRKGKWTYYRLAEGGQPLQNGLREILRRELPGLPETRGDAAALERHLKSKPKAERCPADGAGGRT